MLKLVVNRVKLRVYTTLSESSKIILCCSQSGCLPQNTQTLGTEEDQNLQKVVESIWSFGICIL